MMTIGGLPHILMLIVTAIIIATLMFVSSRVSRKWQNVILISLVVCCDVGILFLHLTHYGTEFDIFNLLRQMLQVCNFNLILLPLCLIKKHELARQYLLMFSMFAAASTFVAYPSDVENSMWNSVVCLTFWINHSLIVAVPLIMVASRRLKPKKEYVFKVCVCIFIYFLVAFVGDLILNNFSFTDITYNYSYAMNAGSIMILKPLFQLIPIPFVYLLPLLPVLYLLYLLLAKIFEKYNVTDY